MLKKIILLLGIVTLGFSSLTFAALSKSSGAYVEGNLGITNKAGWTGIANVGYQFNPNIALEGGYARLGDNYFTLAVKGMIPFNNGFNVFAKVGPSIRNFNMNNLDFYGVVGGGYAFTPNLSGTLQGLWISDNTYAGTVGLTYIF